MKYARFVASVILLAFFIAAFASSTAFAQSGTLQFSSATYSVNESGPFVTVSITRVGGTTGTISTTLTTTDGTAVAPGDYQAQSVTVTFLDSAAGPATIAIPIVDDGAGEGDETFNVQLSGGPLGAPTQATVTIVDNEGPTGVLQFSSPTFSIGENGVGFVDVTVDRVGGSGGTISAQLVTSDGTATAPADYQAQTVTLTFLSGAVGPAHIAIPIVNDALGEGDETFNVQLTGPLVGTPSQTTVTIVDDEGPPGVLQFSSPTFSVNENGAGFVDVTVDRVGGTGGTISAQLTTSDGTATAPADYQAQALTLTFLGGAVGPAHIAIPIVNDAAVEGSETFNVQLSGANVGSPAQATVTIIDDESPPGVLQFSASAYSVNEGAGSVTINVTRVGGTSGAVTSTLTTIDGSAVAPADYQAQNVVVAFADGEAGPKPFVIPIVNDTLAEVSETFAVQLTGGPLGTPTQATVTIVDDDVAAAVQPVPALSVFGMLVLAVFLLGAVYLEKGAGKKFIA